MWCASAWDNSTTVGDDLLSLSRDYRVLSSLRSLSFFRRPSLRIYPAFLLSSDVYFELAGAARSLVFVHRPDKAQTAECALHPGTIDVEQNERTV